MTPWISGRGAIAAARARLFDDFERTTEQRLERALREGKIRSRRLGQLLSATDWAERGTWIEDWDTKDHVCELLVSERPIDGAPAVELNRQDFERWVRSQERGEEPEKKRKRGRPSAMRLLLAEHKSRRKRGVANTIKKREAEDLVAWLTETHPDLPSPRAKTVANELSRNSF